MKGHVGQGLVLPVCLRQLSMCLVSRVVTLVGQVEVLAKYDDDLDDWGA